jgi:protein SCO1/2
MNPHRLIALLLCACTALACAQPLAPAPTPPDAGLDPALGTQLPLDLRFTDAQGEPIVLRDLFGDRPVLLVLGYYRCPQLCGLVMHGLLEALHTTRLPHSAYRVLRVSIDPHDTPVDARSRRDADMAYADFLQGAETTSEPLDLQLLVGTPPALHSLAQRVGFRYQRSTDPGDDSAAYAHPAVVVVVTPEGRVSRYLPGVAFDPWELRLALTEADDGHIGDLVDRVALLCAHVDPRLGRHSEAVMVGVRAVGVLVMLALAAVAWQASRRRRR